MHLSLLSVFTSRSLSVADTDLILRPPTYSDFAAWQKVRESSRTFLEKWEPKWPHDDLTRIGFRRRLKSYSQQWQSGRGRTYFLCRTGEREILGGISLSKITHGTTKSATLGYWMGAEHAGKGFMQKAANCMLQHGFDDLGLNRIEAASIPTNPRSIHLLQKLGFRKEGLARQYLEINGAAEDHVLFAILKSEYEVQTTPK